MLSGLALANAVTEVTATAPIACGKSLGVNIVAASGATNTLTDSIYNNDDNYPDNENAENAVIKCKSDGQVTITGRTVLAAEGSIGIGMRMRLSVSQPYVVPGSVGWMPGGRRACAALSRSERKAASDCGCRSVGEVAAGQVAGSGSLSDTAEPSGSEQHEYHDLAARNAIIAASLFLS